MTDIGGQKKVLTRALTDAYVENNELWEEILMAQAIEVTDATFEAEVLKSDVPVLVDFWAVWCGPCRIIHPIVEELAREYDGKLKVARVDVDKNNQIASQFRIMSIPSLLFFKNGEKVDQVIGAVPKEQLTDKIDSIIA
jgi:thioredoxin 1